MKETVKIYFADLVRKGDPAPFVDKICWEMLEDLKNQTQYNRVLCKHNQP